MIQYKVRDHILIDRLLHWRFEVYFVEYMKEYFELYMQNKKQPRYVLRIYQYAGKAESLRFDDLNDVLREIHKRKQQILNKEMPGHLAELYKKYPDTAKTSIELGTGEFNFRHQDNHKELCFNNGRTEADVR